jgi:hypothetical protein
MDMKKVPFEKPVVVEPAEVLQRFIRVFTARGWLNQKVRIKYGDGRYRVSCSEKVFIAYRLNDNSGLSPGAPGWAVCIIDRNQIVENAEMSLLPSAEPSARDWLQCLSRGEFEVI